MLNKKLDVYYHKRHVGTLAQMPDRRVAFQYSTEWQKNGFSINPISLPLTNEVFIPPEKNRLIFRGLFGTFADSLPDAWGNLLMRNYFASIGINPSGLSSLDLLAYVGTSGMGALEYYPNKMADFDIDAADMNYDNIANECSKILSSQESTQLDVLYKLAASSGGTRPKILLKEDGREWIIKFPALNDPQISGKREYDYSVCAHRCGIAMTETGLIPSSLCDGYFKTERFDRNGNEKVFTSTIAGLLNADYNEPSCDYSTFMRLIQVLTKDNELDKKQMYKQMCFNILALNRDDHTKNFSFVFTEDTGWHLSPAYDITYSTTYYGEHTTSVNGKGINVDDEDLYAIGINAGLSKTYVIDTLNDIKEKVKELDVYINDKPLRKRTKESIKNRIQDISKNG